LSYLANTQTDRQTNKVWQKHNLLGGGNNFATVRQRYNCKHNLESTLITHVLSGVISIFLGLYTALYHNPNSRSKQKQ